MRPLAHSARPTRGIPAQEYVEHAANVLRSASDNAKRALRYRCGETAWFRHTVEWAARYHDLGKLHAANQETLASGSGSASLQLNHVDAGTAYLLRCGLREPAIAVYGHHIGLVDFPKEFAKSGIGLSPFRDDNISAQVDEELEDLLCQHRAATEVEDPARTLPPAKITGLDRRLILSCLVDADHSDTARHYREAVEADPPAPRWADRLAALDDHVGRLPKGGERSAYRTALYQACRNTDVSQAFVACDSPVGSGKTTAVMAYLLRTAQARNLRHVFVVLPYTNIIRQAVDVYRRALCLPGEDPESVVVAHHHLAEFQQIESRHLTALWRAPIIVTTAVQFFETLGAAATARLRKLHELPGSGVFVDEAHAAMPIHLWPFMWNQMEELTDNWGCRFVLGSGSLAKFWENPRLTRHLAKPPVVGVLAPVALRAEGATAEASRAEYRSRESALTLEELADWIESEAGPRVVVMNTVQSAAVIARELRQRGGDVIHLSTALAPADRTPIIQQILAKLRGQPNAAWTLVATSCVEAGLDFDFAIGFRERARAANLAQLGGRVNRHGGRGRSVVWDFTTNDPLLSQHPEFDATRRVVRALFRDGFWNSTGATELMTEALSRELVEHSIEEELKGIDKANESYSYYELARLTRLIQADTRLVVVDAQLIPRLNGPAKIDWKTLLKGSVQLWSRKIDKLGLVPISGMPDVYRWIHEYDPHFLGIMQGALRLIEGDRDGYLLI